MECLAYHPEFQRDLETFFEAAFAAYGWDWDPEGIHSDLRRIPEVYLRRGGFWVLFEDGRITGSVALRALGEDLGEVKRLYVLNEYQGRGLGELLLATALRQGPALGFKKVRLDTHENAEAAIRLFRKFGFKEIERYNDNPRAKYFFEAILPQ